jgi:hypothetical protein
MVLHEARGSKSVRREDFRCRLRHQTGAVELRDRVASIQFDAVCVFQGCRR